ncbi:DUF1294 domain-containing protein [Bacillus sp. FJAT-29790]|uniref:DUF1294 domain-containing protein n=1 Tax=Bacillus sp. FJAT-29790 TaxID=1895002 RepID=UPI001C21B094|nr:DUF1294 domain-containing protein [Bacillus sp. FJAT-29790]MBU8879656.1 DUF1294 domain-containing protein [Bacillus sp. FJAT-29790]
MFKVIIIFVIVMNIAGYYLMKADKNKAKKGHYRVSENTLWLVALLFGATGMTLGMKVFRHKTKHLQFKIGLPVLALIETGFIFYMLNL